MNVNLQKLNYFPEHLSICFKHPNDPKNIPTDIKNRIVKKFIWSGGEYLS